MLVPQITLLKQMLPFVIVGCNKYENAAFIV